MVFDVSTLARSDGQAVGILRVVRELARWAFANCKDATFVLFDPRLGAFRRVDPDFLTQIIDGEAIVDYSTQSNGNGSSARFDNALPEPLRVIRLWMRNPRRRIIVALERIRVRNGATSILIERLQSKLLGAKYLRQLTDPVGARRALLPFDIAAGQQFVLNSNHFVLCPGSDWPENAWKHVIQRKSETDLRISNICYDLIPFLFPSFYPHGASASFEKMLLNVAAHSDLVLVTASQIAADVGKFCDDNNLPQPNTQIFRPGADIISTRQPGSAGLPAGLEAGRFALFVSTLEPRKGHQLLFRVWKRLLNQNVPQEAGFKLVFVGRRGWLVDDMMAQFEADESYGSSFVVLTEVNDNELAQLYSSAAFGLFPSLYEGYGLPAVELFQYGKALLSSSAGALREVVGAFSPCLDPRDENAWFEAMSTWIKDPAARAPFETMIREQFSHPTWEEAAQAFFQLIGKEMESLESVTRSSNEP